MEEKNLKVKMCNLQERQKELTMNANVREYVENIIQLKKLRQQLYYIQSQKKNE